MVDRILDAVAEWTGIVVSLGYLVGAHVRDDVDRVGLVISGVVVALLVGWWLVRRRQVAGSS